MSECSLFGLSPASVAYSLAWFRQGPPAGLGLGYSNLDKLSTSRRLALLTFDDGPGPGTETVLSHLRTAGVQAVFFVQGAHLTTPFGQEMIRRIAAEGHLVGNHSFSHPNLNTLPSQCIYEELAETHHWLAQAGVESTLFRPPFGLASAMLPHITASLGYEILLWNLNTHDVGSFRSGDANTLEKRTSEKPWLGLPLEAITEEMAEAWCRFALGNLPSPLDEANRYVVLDLHDAAGITQKALPQLMKALQQEAGLVFPQLGKREGTH